MADSLDVTILGRGWSFPPSFDKRARTVKLVAGADDVEESLRILFATMPGERVMRPDYGCDLRRFVFETMDRSRLTELGDVLETAILHGEPRVTVDALDIDASRAMDGILAIKLDYTIRSTNVRTSRVFPLYLQEGTLVDT